MKPLSAFCLINDFFESIASSKTDPMDHDDQDDDRTDDGFVGWPTGNGHGD